MPSNARLGKHAHERACATFSRSGGAQKEKVGSSMPPTWSFVVGDRRFELLTPSVSGKCSPPELIARLRCAFQRRRYYTGADGALQAFFWTLSTRRQSRAWVAGRSSGTRRPPFARTSRRRDASPRSARISSSSHRQRGSPCRVRVDGPTVLRRPEKDREPLKEEQPRHRPSIPLVQDGV